MTIDQLLQRFPNGFVVSPKGEVYEVIAAKKSPQDLPTARGYIAVNLPVLLAGDEYYGQDDKGIFTNLTPQGMADVLDRLIKVADTVAEDAILSKLYQTYSERLHYAARKLLDGTI